MPGRPAPPAQPGGATAQPGEPESEPAGAARPWATIAGVAVAGPVGDAEGAGDPQAIQGEDEEPYQRRDWAWVEEWRESGERPAWAPGLALAAFVAVVVGLAVLVLSRGLSDMLWLAIAANVLVAAGLAPALWLSRHLPVLRWISAGAAVGVVVGWIGALIS